MVKFWYHQSAGPSQRETQKLTRSNSGSEQTRNIYVPLTQRLWLKNKLFAMMRKEGIEDEIARLKHVGKALMQQLNIGAVAPDHNFQGGNDNARPRLEKIERAGDRVGCWLLENQVELLSLSLSLSLSLARSLSLSLSLSRARALSRPPPLPTHPHPHPHPLIHSLFAG